jgi:hypothetical protein
MPASGSILLGEVAQHLASVDIPCNFCPGVGNANISRLIHEHGPDMPIPTLLRPPTGSTDRRAVWGASAGAGGRIRAKRPDAMIDRGSQWRAGG